MPEPTDPASSDVVGIDLGGTKIAAAFVDPSGRLSSEVLRRNHSNAGPEAVTGEVVWLVRQLEERTGWHPRGVGIGIAAQVDRGTGVVHHAPNLRWSNIPLGARLGAELGVPVAVLNDARAATVGEWRHGAGQGVDDLLVVFVGTGIGGSVVLGGRLPEGADGAIGEVGHAILVANGRKCHCPGRGCLEAYASGWAVADRAREAILADPERGATLIAASGGPDLVSAESVGRAARSGTRSPALSGTTRSDTSARESPGW